MLGEPANFSTRCRLRHAGTTGQLADGQRLIGVCEEDGEDPELLVGTEEGRKRRSRPSPLWR